MCHGCLYRAEVMYANRLPYVQQIIYKSNSWTLNARYKEHYIRQKQ